MFRLTYCKVKDISTVWIFSIVIIFVLITENVNSEESTTAEPGDSDEVSDLPDSVIEAALYQNYGKFTTMSFHYHNHQYAGIREYDYCYDQYTRCLITLIVPMPVCAYDWNWKTLTKENYCDLYFENCLQKNKWRILAYGKCTAKYVYSVDTFRRFLFGNNNDTDIV